MEKMTASQARLFERTSAYTLADINRVLQLRNQCLYGPIIKDYSSLGGKILHAWIKTLSQDDKNLVEDYLADQIDEAQIRVHEEYKGASF